MSSLEVALSSDQMALSAKIRSHLFVLSHQPRAVALAFSCSFCGLTICVHTFVLFQLSLQPVQFKEKEHV